MRKLALLGSTGSIGTQALRVMENLQAQGEEVQVEVLAARSNVRLLEEQGFAPEAAETYCRTFKKELNA